MGESINPKDFPEYNDDDDDEDDEDDEEDFDLDDSYRVNI